MFACCPGLPRYQPRYPVFRRARTRVVVCPGAGVGGVGALGGERGVEAGVEALDRGRCVDLATEVGGPVPAVGRSGAVGAADADRVIGRIGEDGEVGRAVQPAVQDIRRAGVAGCEVLPRPGREGGVAEVGHPLGRAASIERGVREIAVHGHVRRHPLGRIGERVGGDQGRESATGAEAVHRGEERALPLIKGRRRGRRRKGGQDAARQEDRAEDRCERPGHLLGSFPWQPSYPLIVPQ